MTSSRALSIFISGLALLACGIRTAEYRCFQATNPVDGQPKIKRCVLSPTHGDDFNPTDPRNVDLGVDLSKKSYVFQVDIINRPTDEQKVNAEVVIHSVDLSELSQRIAFSSVQSEWAGADCSYCFDAQGKRTSGQCVFSPAEIQLDSPLLNGRTDIDVRFVFCQVDPAVLLTKEDAAAQCPKSKVDVDIGGAIKDKVYFMDALRGKVDIKSVEKGQVELRMGVVVIPDCKDAEGKSTAGRRVIVDPNTSQKLIFNVCNLAEVRYVASWLKVRQINPYYTIAFEKELGTDDTFTVTNVADIVPTSSPVMLDRLVCSPPFPTTNHFADRLPFAVQVRGGPFNPFFQNRWDQVGFGSTKVTYGEYLSGPSQGYDVYRLRI